MEHTSIDKTVVLIPSRELNLSRRILNIGTLIEEGNINKIRELYDKEVETHGNEANTICCLKVDYYMLNWLLILVYLLKNLSCQRELSK